MICRLQGPPLSAAQDSGRPARRATAWVLWLALAAAGCGGGPVPAALDPRNDACAWCRMTVSQPRFAAQLVAPAEEPRFFDDIGCLADYLRSTRDLPRGSVAFVADHRTGGWVPAAAATFVRCPSLATPMATGLVAFADVASRDADPAAHGCAEVSASELLPSLAQTGGGR